MRKQQFLLACVCAFAACGFQAPQPNRTAAPTAEKPPLSQISATLRLSGTDIVTLLNDRTRSELARLGDQETNCLITKCRMQVTAVRTGDITGNARGSGMQLAVPFALHANLDLGGKGLGKGGEAIAQGKVDAVTQLSLAPDWRIIAHTNGDVHLSNAHLRLGPIKMNVKQLWNGGEEQLSKPIFKAIDKRISSAFKLRQQIGHIWRRLHQPILLGKNPQSWLLLSPQRVRVTPLDTVDGDLVASVAVEVEAHAVMGDIPKESTARSALPAPETLGAPADTFSVAVPVMLSYGDAAKLAMQRLRKKPIRIGRAEVRIDKLQILPSGQDLIVAAQFCVPQSWDFTHLLDSCGQGYLRGTPRFDSATSTIRITGLHYDIGTENLMLRIMRGLAGKELGGALEHDLVFDESREIAKLKAEVSAALSKPQGRGIVLTGAVDQFGEPRLSWTKDGFVALLTAKGRLKTALKMSALQ